MEEHECTATAEADPGKLRGRIIQLQNFSVNDGDGIRTTIFFAGCPLRCQWCANPEGLTPAAKIAYYRKRCCGCGRCAAVCPQGVGIDLNTPQARARCTACGSCAKVCPTEARVSYVREVTVDQVAEALQSQLQIFRRSGGGVTLSGGEPTRQPAFFNALARRLYDMGIDLALETSGCYDFDAVRPGLECMELIFTDIKHMDDAKHRQFTGVSVQPILENIKRYRELPARVVIRVPVIQSVNTEDNNIRQTAAFVHEYLPRAKMELLPYHCYSDMKYEALGMALPPRIFQTPDPEQMAHLNELIRAEGVETVSFR